MANDSQPRERFEEARAVAALNHPHICTLHDIGNQDGVDFRVMEYLDGDTLRGPMPAEEALRLPTQIAGAVADAHRHGILHCDLKPGNVMLTTAGAKVLDFGLAKSMNAQPGVTSTEAGRVVGAVACMSPEQAAGKPLDARSDIFSFGAVLYEMLSGNRAFTGTTAGIDARLSFHRGSSNGAAILEKPVSDRGTLEDLSQPAKSRSLCVRKLLILNGEMSEWSIEHAWKALRWSSVETYRITFSAVVSTT